MLYHIFCICNIAAGFVLHIHYFAEKGVGFVINQRVSRENPKSFLLQNCPTQSQGKHLVRVTSKKNWGKCQIVSFRTVTFKRLYV